MGEIMAYEVFMLLGGIIGIILTILSVLGYKLFIWFFFPIEVPVIIQRGKGFVWDLKERARFVKDKSGYEALKLMKRRGGIKPPQFEYITTNQHGKPVYPIFNTTLGQYFPIKITNPIGLESVEDKASKNWMITELQRNDRKYAPKEGFFMRYGPFIMSATFAAMVIFFVIYFAGKIEIIANSLSGAAMSLTVAMEKLAGAPPPP